ncbi:MAG: guanylate kinase [Bacteroidales bacterium]|nr:guanylate kinase [Bacteroidales bacterium]
MSRSKESEKILIFSAPSGAGKSTIVQYLMKRHPYLGFSISATSRAPRGEEQNGREYYFLTTAEFQDRIKNEDLIEYQEVYKGFYYGTLRSEVERICFEGKIAVFDIDVKGGINLKKLYGERALSIFIMPPNIEALRERLKLRGTETEESIERRVSKATEEIGYASEFDLTLINDNLESCLKEAEMIVEKFYNQ